MTTQAIERIREALLNYAPVSTDILAAFNFRQACDPTAMTEVLTYIDALTAENERLRKDAERYRWLAAYARSTSEHWDRRWSLVIDGPAPKSHTSEDDLDDAIDAAMKGTP